MKRDLFFFYSYRIISRLYFHLPILFAHFFFAGMGITITEILLMVYGLVIMLNSNTSVFLLGYIRQKSVIALGEFLKILGLVLIILGTQVAGTNLWMPFLGQIIGGTGFSMTVSTESGLLRSITNSAEPSLFGKIQSKSQSLMFIATLIGGASGGVLFNYEAHWPFYASILTNVLAIIAVLFIFEEKSPSKAYSVSKIIEISPDQSFWMNYYALSRSVMLSTFIGFLPFFFLMLQLDLNLMGIVLGMFSISAFLSAFMGNKILEKIGVIGFMILTMGSMLTSLLLLGFFNTLGVGLISISLLGFGSGCVRPLTMKNLDITVMNPQQRASLLSSMEKRFSLLNALILITGGYILIQQGFQALMFQMAIAYVILIFFIVIVRTLQTSQL